MRHVRFVPKAVIHGIAKESGSAPAMCAPFVILDAGLLLTWAVLDHLVHLLLHRIKVEGRRVLHRLDS